MTQVFYFLVLTFNMTLAGGYDRNNLTAVSLPEPMRTLEMCSDAGKAAAENYNGPAIIAWTCVPQELEVVE